MSHPRASVRRPHANTPQAQRGDLVNEDLARLELRLDQLNDKLDRLLTIVTQAAETHEPVERVEHRV